MLEYTEPRMIRKIIKGNQEELERHGVLVCHRSPVERSQGGGTPGDEYWLTFKQAITVCVLSKTPKAEDLRVAIMNVLEALKDGKIIPIEGRAVEQVIALRSEVENLSSTVNARFDGVDSRLTSIERSQNEVQNYFKYQRKAPSPETLGVLLTVLSTKYEGLCPLCEITPLLEDGHLTPDANLDHRLNRFDNSLGNVWYICQSCHRRKDVPADKLDPLFRARIESHFDVFQYRCGLIACPLFAVGGQL
jgi:hypothetical protein